MLIHLITLVSFTATYTSQGYKKLFLNTQHLQLDLIAMINDEECDKGFLMPGVYCGTEGNVQPNGEFILAKYYAIKHELQYSCCPNKYPDLTYYVLLRRRPMFYVFNLILPCVLINSIGKTVTFASTYFAWNCCSLSFIECVLER